uniref:Uncharacterized protein n=1 Tax=Melopsittacus undulatus TaxID=13146 RepID=A0A8V5HBH9_MELUD
MCFSIASGANSAFLLLHTKDAVSYVLSIEGRPYTIRLHPQVSLSPILMQGSCYYQGYIDGFPGSAVTLSTCSGLRGLLQLDNVSYGIEPLGYSPAFEHLVYRVRDGEAAGSLLSSSRPEPLSKAAQAPKYLQVYVVLDKALVFHPLNVTIVLASLELWTQGNKVSTAGEAEDLLQWFLQWVKSHLALRPYNIASLLVLLGRDQLNHHGLTTSIPIKTRYQEATTLESFSALLAQLLGRSLGIAYDESPQCRCPGHVCIMSPQALYFSGVKAFSTCSIRDFEAFLRHGGGTCLFSRPLLTGPSSQRAAICGNGIVEPGEQCDCGADKDCLKDKCCTAGCQLKPGAKCSSGSCCSACQFKRKHQQCRPAADEQCDLAEFCTGASASCPPDLYVQDGHSCEQDTGYCYRGRCQSADLQCQQIYGKGNGCSGVTGAQFVPLLFTLLLCVRYTAPAHGFCRDLRCGKLICTYPYRNPFHTDVSAVAYVHVRGQLCVSLNYLHAGARLDPILVPPGTKCGSGQVRKGFVTP